MQDVQITLPMGSVVQERYIVEDLLGKGGFGAVYLVRDLRVRGNLFALKEIIDTERKERARFTFEGQVLSRLDHRALPRVYYAFEDNKNNRAYILMDYIDGPNLENLRKQQPGERFSLSYVMNVMAPIVDAVSYLHRQHPPIIHRDIKPANIIVPRDGGGAMLVDFGIAKEYDQDSTTTAIRRCSPGYGAPEQYAKGTNPRTDIYGLGATFYALLTGEVPADALYRMTQLGSKHTDPLVPVRQLAPNVPAYVENAIQRAMAINSKDRFVSVDDFWQALHNQPVEAVPPPLPLPDQTAVAPAITHVAGTEPTVVIRRQPEPDSGRRRSAWILLFAALALLALLAGLVLGVGLLPGLNNARHPVPTVTPAATQKGVPTSTPQRSAGTPSPAATSTSRPATTPAASPTASATATASATPTKPPSLVRAYQGSLTNQTVSPSITTDMALQNIEQAGSTITGYFTVGPVLTGNGNFRGNVTPDNKVQFLVDSSNGNLPLFFTGQISGDGSMSGTYCSYQNGQCNFAGGGHGVWQVTPGAPGSSFSSLIDVPLLAASDNALQRKNQARTA